MNRANRPALTKVLAERMKMSPEDIEQALRDSLDKDAYTVDARIDMKGFDTVLKLRAEMLNTWGSNPPPPVSKYLDLSYYERALAGL